MAYAVILLGIAAVAVGGYLLLVFREVPGAIEERLGEYEALPQDLGEWRRDQAIEDAAEVGGLIREVRVILAPAGSFRSQRLVKQVRYRSSTTNKIERVEPEQTLKRRRIKRS